MKDLRIVLLFSLFCLQSQIVAAQADLSDDTLQLECDMFADSIQLPMLSSEYYQDMTFLAHNYNYEMINKKRKLKMWAGEVLTLGYITGLGIITTFSIVGVNNDWSMVTTITCGTVCFLASMFPFYIWNKRLKEKADAIDVNSSYLFPINKHLELGVASFCNTCDRSWNALGFSLRTNF